MRHHEEIELRFWSRSPINKVKSNNRIQSFERGPQLKKNEQNQVFKTSQRNVFDKH